MNQLELGGIAAGAMGLGCVIGGYIVENMDSADETKKRANKEIGYSVKTTGAITGLCGAALFSIGHILGESADVGSSGFYAMGGL